MRDEPLGLGSFCHTRFGGLCQDLRYPGKPLVAGLRHSRIPEDRTEDWLAGRFRGSRTAGKAKSAGGKRAARRLRLRRTLNCMGVRFELLGMTSATR